MWTSLILIIMVATDASALVSYITRFTEESFACLISLIFIVEAFKKVVSIISTDTLVAMYNVRAALWLRVDFCSITDCS